MGHYDNAIDRLKMKELERRLEGLSLVDAYYKGVNEGRPRDWDDTPTLRDKFAMSLCGSDLIMEYMTPDETARTAYQFADAFLRERNRPVETEQQGK